MKTITSDKIESITIDESFIKNIIWENDDLLMEIDWCGMEEICKEFNYDIKQTTLVFKFVTGMIINIKFEEDEMGMIFIKKFRGVKTENQWNIDIQCSQVPSGVISFNCYDLEFTIE